MGQMSADSAVASDDSGADPWGVTEATDEAIFDPDDTDVEDAPPTADQTLRYFGADFDVAGLVRRLQSGEITVPSFDPDGTADRAGYEGFQRRFVWPKKQMDRFVESLLLGYPVPGIFLVELPNRKYLVLDGQQRLRTLRSYYDGRIGTPPKDKVFRLEHVAKDLRERSYDSLEPADRRLLDNTFVQATIVVPKEQAKARESVYRLFERINSSGIKLTPQEIRVALYAGAAIRFLRDINSDESWRKLFGQRHSRLKDHELILRYLALSETARALRRHAWDLAQLRAAEAVVGVQREDTLAYTDPMSTYLNRFLNRHASGVSDEDSTRSAFRRITVLLFEAVGRNALRLGGTQINAAHTDAILVGLTLALEDGADLSPEQVRTALQSLAENKRYLDAVSGSTSHADSVTTRLKLAAEAFTRAAGR